MFLWFHWFLVLFHHTSLYKNSKPLSSYSLYPFLFPFLWIYFFYPFVPLIGIWFKLHIVRFNLNNHFFNLAPLRKCLAWSFTPYSIESFDFSTMLWMCYFYFLDMLDCTTTITISTWKTKPYPYEILIILYIGRNILNLLLIIVWILVT